MAKIGSFRRIFKQDYSPENQEDISTLSVTLNDSFETVYGALTNQITLTENINCTLATFAVSVDAKNVPITPTVIKLNNFQKSVNGIVSINAVAKDGISLPTGGLFISYTLNNNLISSSNVTNSGNNNSNPATININNIIGLPTNKSFTITVIVF